MQTPEARVVSQPIAVAVQVVYDFVREMRNLPLWASGLAAGIEHRDGAWVAESPMGPVKVVMAPDNPFGVLDHDVELPDGVRVHNAFRVTPCGAASLLTFVVLRMPGMSQAEFDADVAHIQKDLVVLKRLLEQPESSRTMQSFIK